MGRRDGEMFQAGEEARAKALSSVCSGDRNSVNKAECHMR